SSIVDRYKIDMVGVPAWLTINQHDIRLTPGDEGSLTATFGITPDTFPEAQTVPVELRICSVKDIGKFAEARVTLVVPRLGPRVSISTRPAVVSLLDQHTGRFEVILDNEKSNYARRLELALSDPEEAVTSKFSRRTVEVAAGAIEKVQVEFNVPVVDDG